MLTRMTRKISAWIQSRLRSKANIMRSDKYLIFEGSLENFIKNGARVLEESISLFHGKANPIRQVSANDLNNMNVERVPYHEEGFYNLHQGCWEGRVVLIKTQRSGGTGYDLLREVVVATQMATHNNAHKLLGCCLETKCPVLIYEWMAPEILADRILLKGENQNKAVLEWKDRLRIAWEISHAVAYLHTAFPRPIIHRDLKPSNVLLDQDSAAKLCDYSLSVPIPEGKKFVEENFVIGTCVYIDPEYMQTYKVAESLDVYSFGVLLLVLLTGKHASKPLEKEHNEQQSLVIWVYHCIIDNLVSDIIDPSITRKGVTPIEDLQLRASIQLALFCVDLKGDSRPTMVEVATELKNMIQSPESIPIITRFQRSHPLPEWNNSEKFVSGEQETGTSLRTLTEQSHNHINSANSISTADQIVDPEPNNMAIVSRCNPRENLDSGMMLHDHVTVTVTSITEVGENKPLSVPSFGDDFGREVQYSNVQCSNSLVTVEEVSNQVQCEETKAKSTNKDEMMDMRMQTKGLGRLSSEPLQFLIGPEVIENLPYSCKELHDIMALQPPKTSIAVRFSADIFRYHDTKEQFEAYVTTQNVVHLFTMQWLNSSCLQIFMRYLQNKCKLLKVNIIGFMCPKRLAMAKKHLIFTSQYIQYAISELHSKAYILAPYYQENHWTLIVVCPQRHLALFFDPMGENLDGLVIKGRMNMAYRNCVQSELSPQSLTWKLVQCPRQVNEAECGYYVMRYMYEIVAVTLFHRTHVNLEECFELESYTQQQINEIRDTWARYLIDERI